MNAYVCTAFRRRLVGNECRCNGTRVALQSAAEWKFRTHEQNSIPIPSSAFFIDAVDDFEVAEVLVAIIALDGTLLEQGAAVLEPAASRWVYTITTSLPLAQAVIVHASAVDRPGNIVIKSVHHAVIAA